ncbi:MAG: ATP-binding protein [Candidatus Methanoplasma sp.]|nr:ATP-binding protein [Candidatus Methanoplasma sp.]
MYRTAQEDLLKWKDSADRMPLILSGVRQCGKTHLLKEFGSKNYDGVAYVNFEESPNLARHFDADLDPHRIIADLSISLNASIRPGETLIVFDEIQACARALASLKYFCEDAPEFHVACAGSLLGVRLSEPASFPVGKVDFIDLRPMGFREFLLANGEDALCDRLSSSGFIGVPEPFSSRLETHLRHYYAVGGMPRAVSEWVSSKDFVAVEKIQKGILRSYAGDFGKHAAKDLSELDLIWRSIPAQLSRENRRFIFSHVKSGKRARDLEHALGWLVSAGYVHKVRKISRPGIPLSMYSDETIFKIYFADVGLLRALAGVPPGLVFESGGEHAHFKGALAENFALNELLLLGKDPFYWRADSGEEVDFVDVFGLEPAPIDVKSEDNRRSRSLKRYMAEYSPKRAFRIGMGAGSEGGGITDVPLWAIWLMGGATGGGAGEGLPQ